MKRDEEATAEAESLVRTSVAPGPKRAYLRTLGGRERRGEGEMVSSGLEMQELLSPPPMA